jgi:UDP-N-acetylglucosamine diphosphorylase/glucosamine-1-phosphate N-acetyltransferase
MNTILFDRTSRENLLPLTFTRPSCNLRVGILTIKEKWEKYLKKEFSYLTESYLEIKFPLKMDSLNLLVNGSILPNTEIAAEINTLKEGQILINDNEIIAVVLRKDEVKSFDFKHIDQYNIIQSESEFTQINYPWDIFALNGEELEKDFKLITAGRKSNALSKNVRVLQAENIFIEEGAKVEFSTLNPNGGYIYLGKNSEIMDGCVIRGSFSLGENSTLKLGAKIYGPSTVGPYSKVGGEVNNSVLQGYSNKGHDGFLGNSVIGEWCNLGADTNNSNMKNNYAEVKMWNYSKKGFIRSGKQFCGLIMGDHSKCGINTMFNTGTVVGVSANIFGTGFPRNFIPSFSWGGASGFTTYKINKAFETAELAMTRRDKKLDETEKSILEEVFKQTEEFRSK